jgi:hypothetical protein
LHLSGEQVGISLTSVEIRNIAFKPIIGDPVILAQKALYLVIGELAEMTAHCRVIRKIELGRFLVDRADPQRSIPSLDPAQ